MDNDRDIIFITGLTSVGRTTAYHHIYNTCMQSGIPVEDVLIHDFETLMNIVKEDDLNGGKNHYHNWCENSLHGHTHAAIDPYIPFSITGDCLKNQLIETFFLQLENLQRTKKYWLVQFTAGKNMLPKETRLGSAACSWEKVVSYMESNKISNKWLARVHAVIHIKSSMRTRKVINNNKFTVYYDEALNGYISYKKNPSLLQVYGRDDFTKFAEYLQRHTTYKPPVYTIVNTTKKQYIRDLETVRRLIFPGYAAVLPQVQKIDAIIVTGPAGSGKTTAVHYIHHLMLLLGKNTIIDSDRVRLEEKVVQDQLLENRYPFPQNTGAHSLFMKNGPPGYRSVRSLDGTLLNRIHRDMIYDLSKGSHHHDTIFISEYSTGHDTTYYAAKEKSLRNPRHLLNLLHAFGIQALILNLYTTKENRLKRNHKRPDKIPEIVFKNAYSKDIKFYSDIYPVIHITNNKGVSDLFRRLDAVIQNSF